MHLIRALDPAHALVAAGENLSVLSLLGVPDVAPHPLSSQHVALIRDVVVEEREGIFVSVGDDKRVVLWKREGAQWCWAGTVTLPKKVTHVALDLKRARILAADKFGQCVFLPMALFNVSAGASGRSVSDLEDRLVCGHYASITALRLLPGGLLVTADRDEKLRVARYPQAHSIVAYCLGHGAFVTSLVDLGPGSEGAHWLLSAGADGRLCLWDALRGQLVAQLSWPGLVRCVVHLPSLGLLLLTLEGEASLIPVRVALAGSVPALSLLPPIALPSPLLDLHALERGEGVIDIWCAFFSGSLSLLHAKLREESLVLTHTPPATEVTPHPLLDSLLFSRQLKSEELQSSVFKKSK